MCYCLRPREKPSRIAFTLSTLPNSSVWGRIFTISSPHPDSQPWDETKEKAGCARERTEYFVRENPVPAILGALGIGIAIGLAIRYASPTERKEEIEVKSPLGDLNWSVLSLPFLWPFFKSARKKYEQSAEVMADAMKDGVKRLKKIDVNRYAKPIRKRWKTWTR